MCKFTTHQQNHPVSSCSHTRLKHYFCFLFIWGVGLHFCADSFSQTVELAYRNYTIDDGLPSSECYEVIQDRKGYIWISSDNGVSKFDGNRFINYGPKEGLKDKTVLYMHEDHRGWIWMSTISGNCYIYRGDTIAPYKHNSILQDLRDEYNLIRDFIIDKEGSAHFSLREHSILSISPEGDTLSWKTQKGVYHAGIYKRNGQLLQLSGYYKRQNQMVVNWGINDPDHPEISILSIPKNTGEAEYSNSIGTSFAFQLEDQMIHQFYNSVYLFNAKYEMLQKNTFKKGAINCIYQLTNGAFLVGLFEGKGLIIYDSLDAFFDGAQGHTYFLGNTISHITQAKDGSIWITTTENGVYHIPSLAINVYNFDLGKANFRAATFSKKGVLFLGVANGEIYRKQDKGEWQTLPPTTDLFNLNYLHYIDEKETLITGVPTQYFNINDNNWQLLPKTNGSIVLGIIDHLDTALISFTVRNISRWTYENNQFVLEEEKPYKLNATKCIAQTHPDSIWVGNRSGLYLLGEASKLIKVDHISSMLNVNIRCLKVYRDSSLLIGTKNYGLLILKNGQLKQVSSQNGLIDNTIDRIKTDPSGQVWLTSKKGLNCVSFQNDSIVVKTISKLNGLPSNEVVDVAFSTNHNWVIGKQWATSFPREYNFQTQALGVNITNILVNQKEQPLSSSIMMDWNNSLSVHFTSFNFHAYQSQKYRYRLIATEKWITIDQPRLTFSNLAPQDYQLEIQALQNDQSWSASTILTINVSPPFWQRWWFIGLVFSIIAAAAYYLFNQRIQKLQQEQKQLELEEQINQFKQQAYRAQMNPHFVFNCLNAIQGFIIGGKKDQKQAARLLSQFSYLMRQALEFSRKETVSLREEIRLLDNYLSLEQMRFDHKFDYHISIDEQIDEDWIEVPPMLIQPYVENAVVHGVATLPKKGQIHLDYQLIDEQMLEVSISDNGRGIAHTQSLKKQSKSKRTSAGMQITKNRLDTLSPGDGNLQIKERIATDGSVEGTLIKVRIKL